MLFTRNGGITGLTVEIVEILRFDVVVAGLTDTLQHGKNLCWFDYLAMSSRHEAATPGVGAECLGHAFRPASSPSFGNCDQFEIMAAGLLDVLAQSFGAAAVPIQKNIN